ncbi:hypothetical protein OQA88_1198 [Cercophora sp. LCS_1]
MARFWKRRTVPWTPESARRSDGHPMPNYKPVSLGWPFLTVLGLYLGLLIGLVEYGNRILPQSYDWDVDSLAPTQGDAVGRPSGFITGGLRARQTAAPEPMLAPRSTPRASRLQAKRPAVPLRRHSGLRFVRRNETGYRNGTAPTPFMVSGTDGYSPALFDYFNLTHPPPTYNLSTSLNETHDEEPELRKRIPGMDSFGELSGPVVRLTYDLHFFSQEIGREYQMRLSFTELNPEDPGTYAQRVPGCDFDSPLKVSDRTWCVDGMVTCNGPEVVFHEDKAWEKWQQASAFEDQLLSSGTPIFYRGTRTWYSSDDPDWPRCQGPDLEGIYKRYQFDRLTAIPDNLNTENLPVETAIVINDESGNSPATVTGEILYGLNPSGSLQPTATRLKALPSATVAATTYTDAQGKTHTASPTILKNTAGVPTATAFVLTLRDASGNPTRTTTSVITSTLLTLRDSSGNPTATLTVDLPRPVRTVHTLTDAQGNPTATITVTNRATATRAAPPVPVVPSSDNLLHLVTPSEYWLILFLPILLAIIASILAQILYSDIRALLPFNALTRQDGANAGQSLAMKTGGLSGLLNSVYLLVRMREPLAFLSDLLVFLLAVVVTLSPEAVGIKLYGRCAADNSRGCYMGVAIFVPPSRAVQAILGACLMLVVGIAVVLARWKTGVAAPTRGIGATASLAQNAQVRGLLRNVRVNPGGEVTGEEVMERLGGRKFCLGRFRASTGIIEYGITTTNTTDIRGRTFGSRLTKAETFLKRMRVPSWGTVFPKSGLKRRARYRVQDCAGVGFMLGIMGLVVYYNVTGRDAYEEETGFETWMNDQNFGVRVVFTGLGVVITFLWDGFYARTAMLEPYRQLWIKEQEPADAVMVSPPTSVFTGFAGAVKRGEVFMTIVAFTTILAKFVPTLLSTVPFSPIQTWQLHLVCSWMTVGSLAFMSLVLGYGLLFVHYPPLPIDPATLAGRIYYLCDSPAVEDFRGLSLLSGRESKKRVDGRKRYRFGKMIGASGEVRIGLDRVDNGWDRYARRKLEREK